MDVSRRQFGILIAAAGASPAKAEKPQFPDAHWDRLAPEEAGFDAAALERLSGTIKGRGCIVRNGVVAHTWGAQDEVGDWLSSAKPVLSTLLLFAIAEGRVRSVETRIRDFGWDLASKDRPMTFWHLANMVSGYARPEPPGAAWAYNDHAIQLYQQTLFDKVFRDDPEAAAMSPQRLGCLQFEDGLRFRPANRRLSASVRDFARIAWFWVNRGRWKDRQVLPRELFDRSRKPQVPRDLPQTAKAETNDYLKIGTYGGGSDHFTESGPGIYGFNWWFNATGRLHPRALTWPDAPRDTFMSIGAGGNCAVMIPSLQLVFACARGDWGKVAPGDPEWQTNRHIAALVSALKRPGWRG
jgi:CubicO group peptidase (beta-lactamase class C family)